MKTSLSNLFAVVGLACVLSLPALAASSTTTDSLPSDVQGTPGATALPPGTLPSDPSMGNGGDASGSSVRPDTRISPDIHEKDSKDPDARQKMQREQNKSGNTPAPGSTSDHSSGSMPDTAPVKPADSTRQ